MAPGAPPSRPDELDPFAGWRPGEAATLVAVAETLVRGDAERRARLAAAALQAGTDPADIARLRLALRAFESGLANLALAGRPVRFRDMSPAARERYLLGWAGSRLKDRRVAFQALKRLLCFMAYADPGEPGPNPRWERIGYVPEPDAVTSAPTTVRVEAIVDPLIGGGRSTVALEADVAIVGSGAGGGVVACALAEAGRSVIVLEAGPFVPEPEMPTGELDAFDRLYLDHVTTSASDAAVAILAGSCVGGGTLVNWATCIAPPGLLREEWAREHGLHGFDAADLEAEIATLEAELGVVAAEPVGPKDSAILRGGAGAGLGDTNVVRRNGDCAACGSCGFGCRRGSKASGLRVHLAQAHAAGARIVADAVVERVLVEDGHAAGVVATVRPSGTGSTGDGLPGAGIRVEVRARQVVVAAGALRTPAVLARSGIDHPQLGHNLRLHPVPVLGARFAEPVDMWRGVMQAARIVVEPGPADRHARYTIESAPGHPGLLALAFPWDGADAFSALMEQSRFFAPLVAVCRDLDGGRVSVTRTGRVRIDYRVSRRDAATMRAALAMMARVAREAGASELIALGTPARRYTTVGTGRRGGADAAFATYVTSLQRWDPAPGRGMVFSAHQMGSARAGAEAVARPCDPEGRVRSGGPRGMAVVPGLYVADASLFPTAAGVNPMITTMLLARRVARTVLAEGSTSG